MKIKFPFFSRKLKAVCTTEQVIHQVDGQDKKLSEVLNSSGGAHPLVTINGKDPLDYGELCIAMLYLATDVKNILDELGISHLYFNSPVDLTFETTSESAANVYFTTSAFRFDTTTAVENNGVEPQTVVGEVLKVSRPSDDTRYNNYDIVQDLGAHLREVLENTSGDTMQAILDYFNAQNSND